MAPVTGPPSGRWWKRLKLANTPSTPALSVERWGWPLEAILKHSLEPNVFMKVRQLFAPVLCCLAFCSRVLIFSHEMHGMNNDHLNMVTMVTYWSIVKNLVFLHCNLNNCFADQDEEESCWHLALWVLHEDCRWWCLDIQVRCVLYWHTDGWMSVVSVLYSCK